jgi:hypothetical protein
MNKNFWIIVFALIIIVALSASTSIPGLPGVPGVGKNGYGDTYILIALIIIVIIVIVIMGFRIQEKFEEADPMLVYLKETISKCFPEIDSTILLKGKKSYTINKKRIHLCLTDEKGDYYDKHMLMYVTLHELAHVICTEVGHTDEFYRVFNKVLDRAEKHGLHDRRKPLIKDYCEYAKE